MNWLIARLKESSTWRGIVWLLTVFGLSLRPDQAEAIIVAGMALAGLLGVFLSDESKTNTTLPPIALQGHSEPGNAALGIGAVQPVDELRLSANNGQHGWKPGTADSDIYPNFRSGFGDRD